MRIETIGELYLLVTSTADMFPESMLVEQSVGANDLSPVVEPEETSQSVIT